MDVAQARSVVEAWRRGNRAPSIEMLCAAALTPGLEPRDVVDLVSAAITKMWPQTGSGSNLIVKVVQWPGEPDICVVRAGTEEVGAMLAVVRVQIEGLLV